MDTRQLRWAVGVVVLALVTLACNFSFSTAKVEDVRLARDEEGDQETRARRDLLPRGQARQRAR
jgi:hypothetical protein